MNMNRRTAIKTLAASVPAFSLAGAFAADEPVTAPEIQAGPFDGTAESLKDYRVPEWFRDAKFGIWAHWGPQSAAEDGDWYARNIYIESQPQYKTHLERFGHPSKFGHKDICKIWTADKFDADHLMELYKKAGAKYFMSMGVHHDNFDLWDSKYQPKWNSVAMGPKKDIVGMFKKAAQKQGLKFAVSEHLAYSYNWWTVSHGSDKTGPLAGVPYDGADPQYADLYHEYDKEFLAPRQNNQSNRLPVPLSWRRHYIDRLKDLIDKYEPDLLYNDGGMIYPEVHYRLVSHLYNVNAKAHGGKVEAVYTSKGRKDSAVGTCVFDIERGVADQLLANPWQTDTCIGNWHYKRGLQYKTPKRVIDMLCDIVSRNGNLMLNFPLPNNGELDPEELKVLDGITRWMAVNSEAIHSTRPWKIFGAGPGADIKPPEGQRFNENARKDLTAEDVRYTTKGDTLYALVMGWPDAGPVAISSLATGQPVNGKVEKVELLGRGGELKFTQDEQGLKVKFPDEKPCDYCYSLKITGLKLT